MMERMLFHRTFKAPAHNPIKLAKRTRTLERRKGMLASVGASILKSPGPGSPPHAFAQTAPSAFPSTSPLPAPSSATSDTVRPSAAAGHFEEPTRGAPILFADRGGDKLAGAHQAFAATAPDGEFLRR